MKRSRLPGVARQLLNEVPDADLLERYATQQANDAFAPLVARYSRLVWGQCRNLLPNDADADDAFQATFLTLARSVKKLKPGAPLGPWLHGVAFRVCMNARRANARRTKREQASAQSEASRPVADSTWDSAFAAVAEEVQKLPEAQRAAFVLCGLEGRSEGEAALALGQKIGTISSRLARAKRTLLDRLARRGIGATILALGGVTGSVAVAPAALISRTLALVPSGVVVPSSIHVLMQGVTGMAILRFKLLAAGVMVATGLGLSAGGGWYATAQGPGAGLAPANPKADPPRGAPNIDKLKADLDKAKADLALAEQRKAEKDSVVDWTHNTVEYEYEPVPKEGFLVQEFERKVNEREKAGWRFLGIVPIQRLKDDSGVFQEMVFRRIPKGTDPLQPPDLRATPKLPPPEAAPPAKGATKILASDIVKVEVQRHFDAKGAPSKAATTIEDQEKIGELLALFPEVGTAKKADAGGPAGYSAGYILTLHRKKGDPVIIIISHNRKLWYWSDGTTETTKTNGDRLLKNPKPVEKFFDELLK